MRSEIPALRRLWQEAFSDEDGFLDIFFSTAFSPDRCLFLKRDNAIASALYWLDCSAGGRKYAYIYAVATAKSHRGQGLCRELMALAHQTLRETGYAGAILVPGGEPLFAMYEKLGYIPFSGVNILEVLPDKPVPMQKVSTQAYATLRRKFLPKGGVVQEGENLLLLEKLAELYAGDGFVAAVAKSDELFCMELLGDGSAAPGIVAALGKESGRFRVPGNRPFAMYHPLLSTSAPSYFGLAFD